MAVLFLGTRFQSFKNDGTVNAGGTVEFYDTGTSTHKNTYSDSALTVANSWPVTLNSAGAADIWYSGDADVIVKDSAGTTLDSFTSINPATVSTTTAPNIITNGSFEEVSGTDPASWTQTLYTGGTGAQDSDSIHGYYAWKFTSVGNGGGYITTDSAFLVAYNRPILLYWDMKGTADVRNVVDILWYDDTDALLSTTTAYDNSTTNPTSYTRKYYTAIPPINAVTAKIRLYGCHSSDSTSGNTFYDNLNVVDGGFLETVQDSVFNIAGSSDNTKKVRFEVDGLTTATTRTLTVPDESGTLSIANPIIGSTKSLKITNNATNPNYQLDITADAIVLENSNSVSLKLATWSVTVDITASGANGLDTGAEANSTWYYVWAIYDGTNKRSLFSASATAPTLPTGYTYKALIGAWYNDSGGNLVGGVQLGKEFYYKAGKVVLNAGTATTETSVDIAAYVPPVTVSEVAFLHTYQVGTDAIAGIDVILKLRFITSVDYVINTHKANAGGGLSSVTNYVPIPLVATSYYYLLTITQGADVSTTHRLLGFRIK